MQVTTMNIRKLRLSLFPMSGYANGLGNGLDPFAAGMAGYRVTDRGMENVNTPTSSQATPGKQYNDREAPTGNQLEDATKRSGGSPLDSYMDSRYYAQDTKGKDDKPADDKAAAAKPKSVLESDYSEWQTGLSKTQFVHDTDAELIDKATKGDTSALMSLLNSVGQRAAASGAFLSTRAAQAGITEFDSRLKSELPQHIRETEFASTTLGDPELDQPKYAMFVDSAIKQFREAYPGAPAQAIKQAAAKYLRENLAIAPANKQDSTSKNSMKSLFDNLGNN